MKFWSIFFALTVRSTVPLSLHPPRRTLRAVPARARICFQKKQRLVFLQKNRHFFENQDKLFNFSVRNEFSALSVKKH